ncbi:MAG: hypothetical protein OEX00_10765, partial [Gammaproteobacteria bacterium]|nr:hypothetical protein [Gammaproteobacteria bacterium]
INQDKQVAAQLLAKSVKSLETAQKNSRFFPNASYDVAVHDTYFYLAMSYHKLYQLSQNPNLLNKAKLAWRDYLDFFPESLANVEQYSEAKNSASQFLEQLRGDS